MTARQVLLDIPSCASKYRLGVYASLSYTETGRARWLYCSVVFFRERGYRQFPAVFFAAVCRLRLPALSRHQGIRRGETISCFLVDNGCVRPIGHNGPDFRQVRCRSGGRDQGGDRIRFRKAQVRQLALVPAEISGSTRMAAIGLVRLRCCHDCRGSKVEIAVARQLLLPANVVSSGLCFFSLLALKSRQVQHGILFPLILCSGFSLRASLPRVGPVVGWRQR